MSHMNIDQLLQRAIVYHQKGQIAEAQKLYQDILQFDPCHADALHLLGVLARDAGNTSIAENLSNVQ